MLERAIWKKRMVWVMVLALAGLLAGGSLLAQTILEEEDVPVGQENPGAGEATETQVGPQIGDTPAAPTGGGSSSWLRQVFERQGGGGGEATASVPVGTVTVSLPDEETGGSTGTGSSWLRQIFKPSRPPATATARPGDEEETGPVQEFVGQPPARREKVPLGYMFRPYHQEWDGDKPIVRRAIVIAFVPKVPSKAQEDYIKKHGLSANALRKDLPLWAFMNRVTTGGGMWFEPRKLVEKFIEDIKFVTHGKVQFQVDFSQDYIEIPKLPYVKGDNRDTYTIEKYLEDYGHPDDSRTRKFNDSYQFDYERAIVERNIAGRLALDRNHREKIHEIWIFAPPGVKMYETTMMGKGAIECNSPPLRFGGLKFAYNNLPPTVIYGFSYERGVDCMLENLAHRVEYTVGYFICRAWRPYTKDGSGYSPEKNNTLFDEFIRWKKRNPDLTGCGFVHLAHNSNSWAIVPGEDGDKPVYDWESNEAVLSNCDGWLSRDWVRGLPGTLNTRTRKVSAREWLEFFPRQKNLTHEPLHGWHVQRYRHLWWLYHLPHFYGVHADGTLLNWWKYIFDFAASQNEHARR